MSLDLSQELPEAVCRKKRQNSSNQESGLGTKMSDSFNHLGSIWYQSEPLEVPYCPIHLVDFGTICGTKDCEFFGKQFLLYFSLKQKSLFTNNVMYGFHL